MQDVLILLKKDLLQESRSLENIIALFTLSLLIAVVIGVGLSGGFLEPHTRQQLFPSLIWIGFLFSTTLAMTRILEPEFQSSAYQAIILSGTPLWKLYLSKLISISLLVIPAQLFQIWLLGALLGVSISGIYAELLLITFFTTLSYVALVNILAVMATTSRIRGVLLPLLLIPILFPVFLSAIEITNVVVQHGGLDLGNSWLSFLVGLATLYVLVGLNLFEHTLQE